jgi:hypothetical protein
MADRRRFRLGESSARGQFVFEAAAVLYRSQYEIWKSGPAILNCSKRPTSPLSPTSLPRIYHPQLDGVVSIPESERFAVGREGN